MPEITIKHEGKEYTADYAVFDDDSMFVTLPDGTQKDVPALRGLHADNLAKNYLESWIKSQKQSAQE